MESRINHGWTELALHRGHIHASIQAQAEEPGLFVLLGGGKPFALSQCMNLQILLQFVVVVERRAGANPPWAFLRSIEEASRPTPRYGRRCQ